MHHEPDQLNVVPDRLRVVPDRLRVVDVLEQGITDGTHIGAQLYVSRAGVVVADVAVGRARADVEMRPDSMMTWFSMSKAVTAVAVAQQWERGALDPDDTVMRHIREFGVAGKENITIRHLLTHTAGLAHADGILDGTPWRESRADNLARIYAATPEYEPGTRAGYHPAAGMSVLGEVVARVSGIPFDQYVRDEIFGPLGMDDCWIGMPRDRYDAYGDRIGFMHTTSTGTPEQLRGLDSAAALGEPRPGMNGRGPMNQLGRFYEMLVGRGTRDGVRVLSPVTVVRDLGPAPDGDARRGLRHRHGLGPRPRRRLVRDRSVLVPARVRSRWASVVGRVL